MKLLCTLLALSSLAFCQHRMFYSQNQATASFPSGFANVASSTTGCVISSGGTTHCSYGLHGTVTSGHLMVVHAWWPDGGNTITNTFSCTNNGTFNALTPKQNDGTVSGQMYWKVLTSTGADTCTMNLSATETSGGWLSTRYSFTGTISGTDGTAGYLSSTSSGTTGTITGVGPTTASTSGVLIAQCIIIDTACTGGAGFTTRNDTAACDYDGASCPGTVNYGTTIGGLIEDKFNASPGAQSATFTTGSGDHFVFGLVAF